MVFTMALHASSRGGGKMGVGDRHMAPGETVKQGGPLIFLSVLGTELRALYMLSKLSS